MSVYGYCPKCGAPGVTRERRPDGDDKCSNGCVYPSRDAVEHENRSNLVLEKDPEKLPAFQFDLPAVLVIAPGRTAPYKFWADLHERLGQELAKRMRVYPGPSTEPDGGDIGGTPAAMPARMAA